MLLQLDEEYRVVASDKLNYSLEKYEEVIDIKSKLPTGERKWKVLGHYGFQLNHALKRYANEKIRDSGETTHHELIDRLNELSRHIDKVVKKENIIFVPKERKKDE
jgi:hypothetical protein